MTDHIWRIIIILTLWLATLYVVTHFSKKFLTLVLTKKNVLSQQRATTLSGVVSQLLRITIVLIFGMMLLSEFGIPVIPVFAGAGVLGVIIGFGAQSVIKDVLAGLFVVYENNYTKGELVKLGEITGVVEDVSLRITILRDQSDVVHYIPNGSITVISNYSRTNKPGKSV
ncbi:MAG: mechanosensitive ion channel domain-containing protein [Patescibacteria group bacterium]|jgi:small conductance mechanosensitive channel